MRDPTPPYLKNFIKRAAEPMSEAGKENKTINVHLHPFALTRVMI